MNKEDLKEKSDELEIASRSFDSEIIKINKEITELFNKISNISKRTKKFNTEELKVWNDINILKVREFKLKAEKYKSLSESYRLLAEYQESQQ